MVKKHGRHTSAFILLLLAEEPSYGASILTRLETELPHCFSDSADVYRCLQEMSKDGLLETQWETQENGQPRKWYKISEKGILALKEQAEDIRLRMANFDYFLKHYNNISKEQEQLK